MDRSLLDFAGIIKPDVNVKFRHVVCRRADIQTASFVIFQDFVNTGVFKRNGFDVRGAIE
jgi:hypothetical protein